MTCPTCGQEVDVHGTHAALTYHFARRALEALHKLRQALHAQGMDELAALISSAILKLESVVETFMAKRGH